MQIRSAHTFIVRYHRDPAGYEPEVLVNFRNHPQVLEIPGGSPNPNEDLLDCAFREASEEVGIPVTFLDESSYGAKYLSSSKYPGEGYLLRLCLLPDAIVLDHEHTNCESDGNIFVPLSVLADPHFFIGHRQLYPFQRDQFIPLLQNWLAEIENTTPAARDIR